MKKNYYNELLDIQNMAGKIRTISEAIQFEDEYDDGQVGMEGEPAPAEPQPQEEPLPPMEDGNAEAATDLAKLKVDDEPDPEQGLRELGEVDQIREIALRGMIKLCKNPEDDRYQALKKIFQFCDKAAENKDKEGVQA